MSEIEELMNVIVYNFYSIYHNSKEKKLDCEQFEDIIFTFNKLNSLISIVETSNIYIENYIKSIESFIKSTDIEIEAKRTNAINYLKNGMNNDEKFNYFVWGQMHTSVQRLYLRVYQYYSKAQYELSKPL